MGHRSGDPPARTRPRARSSSTSSAGSGRARLEHGCSGRGDVDGRGHGRVLSATRAPPGGGWRRSVVQCRARGRRPARDPRRRRPADLCGRDREDPVLVPGVTVLIARLDARLVRLHHRVVVADPLRRGELRVDLPVVPVGGVPHPDVDHRRAEAMRPTSRELSCLAAAGAPSPDASAPARIAGAPSSDAASSVTGPSIPLEPESVDLGSGEDDDRQCVEPDQHDHDEDERRAEPRDRGDVRQVRRERVVHHADRERRTGRPGHTARRGSGRAGPSVDQHEDQEDQGNAADQGGGEHDTLHV